MAKALIISSDKETRFVYEKAIAFQKFVVSSAEDVKRAVKDIAKQWPDLVVLDYDNAAPEEIEELKKLKPPKKHLPIIILTDLKDPSERKKACVLGACKYLSKSQSTLGDLIKTARKAIK